MKTYYWIFFALMVVMVMVVFMEVEIHVDDLYFYCTKLGPFGGCPSVRIYTSERPSLTFGQDKSIFRSSQLNESCWTVDGKSTIWTKGLEVGLVVSSFASHASGFGMEIVEGDLVKLNQSILNKVYADKEA